MTAAALLVTLMAAALAAPGPGLRLGPPAADGTAIVEVLDARGHIASRVNCPRNQYVDSGDAAAKLIASPAVAATLLAKDGHLVEIDDLGPAKFDCVIVPF